MAIPLAIGRVRGQRSYGLVIGLAFLMAFYQVLQVGESLADNNKLPSWLGLWVPFAVFGLVSASCSSAPRRACPIRGCRFVGRHQVDRLGRLLPRRRSAVAAARMSVLTIYLNRMFVVRFLVVLFGVIGFATVIDLIDVGAELVRAPEGALAAGLRYFSAAAADHAVRADADRGPDRQACSRSRDLLRHRELIVDLEQRGAAG